MKKQPFKSSHSGKFYWIGHFIYFEFAYVFISIKEKTGQWVKECAFYY